jgi:hypothetical protein
VRVGVGVKVGVPVAVALGLANVLGLADGLGHGEAVGVADAVGVGVGEDSNAPTSHAVAAGSPGRGAPRWSVDGLVSLVSGIASIA